jgi:hypothetical protein
MQRQGQLLVVVMVQWLSAQQISWVVIAYVFFIEGRGHETEEPLHEHGPRPQLHESLEHGPGDLVLKQQDLWVLQATSTTRDICQPNTGRNR